MQPGATDDNEQIQAEGRNKGRTIGKVQTVNWKTLTLIVLMPAVIAVGGQQSDGVRIWQEPLVLPTYKVHPPDVNPMFRRPLSYQGASKVIYPYPLLDNLSNVKEDRSYNALYLENAYIKLCVLPELGGRLFYATDKTNGYEIFYRQHVIKPSNIGMLGAWISGGIEWCVFHHHRASTFMPVDYRLISNSDGSKTIWVGEIEPRHRMKWSIGMTLRPGSSCIEARVKMFNRTDQVNSILYWANVATHANDDYQIFFPPSTEFGTYHAKNYFTHWPIGTTKYLDRDYVGVDLSWWKNHPSPVSIFAHDLKEGFLAGYDHGREAGTMHVANPHIVKGAKLWEWGPGEVGSMWDSKVLTDTDGPYAELMAGAYSDNQPDYSWIKPYEVKEANQYWYPLREIGGAKAANLDAAMNLEIRDGDGAFIGVNVTQRFDKARIVLESAGKTLLNEVRTLSPATPYTKTVALGPDARERDLHAAVYSASGETLVSYSPVQQEADSELPDTVKPPRKPEEIGTVEELYLTGLRIKQFHNARLNPNDYFEEALKRDPNDSRCNVQLGIYYAQRGLYEKAKASFGKAIGRIGKDYTRPRNCEAYYHLGLVLKRQGKYKQAYENLYRAAWDYAFRSAAYYKLAEISSLRGQFEQALEHVERSLLTNSVNTKALNFKSAVLRKLGRSAQANQVAVHVTSIDPLDHWAMNEQYLALTAMERRQLALRQLAELQTLMRDQAETYLELAADYMGAGMWEDAADVLERAVELNKEGLSEYPTVHYYLAHLYAAQGKPERSEQFYRSARRCPSDYCFPFRLESIDVLQRAIEKYPQDAMAQYYMGNVLFDLQPDNAIDHWEKAVQLDDSPAIAHRNLGWGYYYGREDIEKAIASYEEAIAKNPEEPRYYYELDVLYERNGADIETRLKVLEGNHEHLQKREDSLIREIIVLVQAGKYDKAIEYLGEYFFHIQEGNRRLHDTYVDAHLLRGLTRYESNDYERALQDFLAADEYPENHQIGRDRDYERNVQINLCTGLCYEELGEDDKAKAAFEKAIAQDVGRSEYIFYQGAAHKKLGNGDKANEIFEELIEMGQERLDKVGDVDFFAKFGEGEPAHVRKAAGHYMIGLGRLGLGREGAEEAMARAVELDVNHVWARYALNLLRR